MTLDDTLDECLGRSINLAVPWFLITSYAYYRHDVSLLSDDAFDRLCKTMAERYDEITHQHKPLVTLDMLRAGTGYSLAEDQFPTIVKSVAHQLMEKLRDA